MKFTQERGVRDAVTFCEGVDGQSCVASFLDVDVPKLLKYDSQFMGDVLSGNVVES